MDKIFKENKRRFCQSSAKDRHIACPCGGISASFINYPDPSEKV